MSVVADAVSVVLEAADGVKCSGCGAENGKGSVKCKGCSKDMKQPAGKGARSHVGEAVAAVLEADGKDGKGKGKRSSRNRKGKFADLPTLATGKRAVKDEAPAAKGAAEGDGPTAVAEAMAAALEADAWGGKPGPNFKQVTPEAKHKLSGILKHYKGMAHPFTQCVKDNRKRFGEGAEKVCAVVKDLNEGTTKWRKGATQEADVDAVLEAAGIADDAGALLLCEALTEGLPPVGRAVLEAMGG